jgi:CBS domain-containing protein
VVLVQHILDGAQKRLAVLNREAPVFDVAEILANPETPLVVVCDDEGIAVGVITRADIVRVLARAKTEVCRMSASEIMTPTILSCHVDHPLQRVWAILNNRSLRCAPILDDNGRPRGVVHARDVARALLQEVTQEEELLRDYVLGVGYQ